VNNSIISSILLSCLAVTVNAADLTSVADQMSISLSRGSIEILSTKSLKVTPEIAEIIRQINNSNQVFDKPILIFSDDEILVNDSKALTEVLSATKATMTSL
jgi:hypothetical protein